MLAAAEVDAAGSLNSAELERDLAAAIRKHFDQSRLVDTLSKARDLAARNRRQFWARSRSRAGQLLRAENSCEGTAFTASAVGRTSDLAEYKTGVRSRWRQWGASAAFGWNDSSNARGNRARLRGSVSRPTDNPKPHRQHPLDDCGRELLFASRLCDRRRHQLRCYHELLSTALDSVIGSWTAGQAELKHLLEIGTSDLLSKLRSSLALIALVAGLSLVPLY